MYEAGVGLAAVLVGILRFVCNGLFGWRGSVTRIALINPEVLRVEGNQNGEEDVCHFGITSRRANLRAIVRARM
jgi:peptide deformylase